jgi:hypothetical protein
MGIFVTKDQTEVAEKPKLLAIKIRMRPQWRGQLEPFFPKA